jgi:hypothetical protein
MLVPVVFFILPTVIVMSFLNPNAIFSTQMRLNATFLNPNATDYLWIFSARIQPFLIVLEDEDGLI